MVQITECECGQKYNLEETKVLIVVNKQLSASCVVRQ